RRFGESGFLAELETFLHPIELGGDEQVYVQAVAVAPVDAVVELRVLFDPRSGAAPEGLVFGAEGLPVSGCQREIVLRVSDLRADRSDAVIEQQALIVVEVARI